MLDIGLCAQVACIWEVTARKPGNVTRYDDFDDVTYLDFLLSAAAITPVLAAACQRRVGETVLQGVRATRQVIGTNTNLGILLLLSPLAAVPEGEDLQLGVEKVLADLDIQDSCLVYEAIRLAAPGGLGAVAEQDIRTQPTQPLREVMALVAERDLVARQYADGFAEVFNEGLPALRQGLQRTGSLEGAIVVSHLHLMASHPDTLIARKCGQAVAEEAARRARQVVGADWPSRWEDWSALQKFDAWLRADGHRRNPGTTADVVTACLFVALRQGVLSLPLTPSWQLANSREQGREIE
jgi:triphosphoribosyl-dephospho-CoA synthase